MASKGSDSQKFPAHVVEHPFNTLSQDILPPDMEAAVENITAGELVDLVFRLDRNLAERIEQTLPGGAIFANMQRWFGELFGHAGVLHNRGPRFLTLQDYWQYIRVPEVVRAQVHAKPNQYVQDRLREQYGAQAFLRGLLTDLRMYEEYEEYGQILANHFLQALRSSPVPSSQPQLQLAMDLIPSTTAPTSTKQNRKLYCPLCGRSAQEGDFRMLKSHWFEEHRRSNRSAVELEKLRTDGELGPWTAEEAKSRGKDKESIQETEDDKKRRAEMKRKAVEWRRGMQTDPLEWEEKAQEEDGYDDFDLSYVDYSRQKRAAAKKKSVEQKKKQGEKGGE